jgi:hypothetical protein
MRNIVWPSFLAIQTNTDGMLRALAIVVAAIVLIHSSTMFEREYSKKLTELYIHPWWRLLVVLLIVSSAMWCPSVGIVVALVTFFYLSDMNTLITPMTNL